MNISLHLIRYVLIIAPTVGSMYLESYDSYGLFTLLTLALLWLVGLTRNGPARWLPVFVLLEIGLSTWMSTLFMGVMFMSLFSTMLVYMHKRMDRLWLLFTLVQLAALQIALYGRLLVLHVMADVMFVVILLLLIHMKKVDQHKDEMEQVFDSLRQKHYELDEARHRLIDYAKQVEAITQTGERNRISRDIHDNLGHRLIRLKMMMDAAIRIFPSDPAKGMDMFDSVREQLTDSMELLRATVRELHPDQNAAQRYSLSKLIEDFGADSGVQVHYEVVGFPYSLYPSLEYILYRNAQESISNAIRHGAATEVQIVLNFEPKQVVMQISNNGAPANGKSRQGMGLRGMEERVRLVGGRLLIEPETLYTVITILPTHTQP